MPTENLSSNKENSPCPFCGGQVDPEGWLRGDGVRGPECDSCGATAPTLGEWNSVKPAEQHQGEPVGTLLIDEYFDGREVGDVDVQLDTKVCEQLAEKYPGQSLPLYIGPAPADPGEVERLRKENARLRLNISEMNEDARIRDGQIAERDALLRAWLDMFAGGLKASPLELLESRTLAALSASAEPSAPGAELMAAAPAEDHLAAMASAMRVIRAEPSAPVEPLYQKCTVLKDAEVRYSNSIAPVDLDERAAFEKGYHKDALHRDGDEYSRMAVQMAWEGWQARAALERKPS